MAHAPTPSGQKRSTFDAAALVDAHGIVDVTGLAATLLIDRRTLASIAGLPRGALAKTARPKSPAAEARLRDIVDILARVTPWAGSPPQALAWYRAQPLAGFGGTTAQEIVRQGHADAVKAHLETVADGGYA